MQITPQMWLEINERKGIPLGTIPPALSWYAWRDEFAYRDLEKHPLEWLEVVGLEVPVYDLKVTAKILKVHPTTAARLVRQGVLRPLPQILKDRDMFSYTEVMRVVELRQDWGCRNA